MSAFYAILAAGVGVLVAFLLLARVVDRYGPDAVAGRQKIGWRPGVGGWWGR